VFTVKPAVTVAPFSQAAFKKRCWEGVSSILVNILLLFKKWCITNALDGTEDAIS
jgi:hypothetical protein